MAGDTPRLARAAQEGTGRPVEWLAGVEPARGAGRWSTSAAKKRAAMPMPLPTALKVHYLWIGCGTNAQHR